MGMVAILTMWQPFEQIFVPPFQGRSICPKISEEKMFENVDNIYTYISTAERTTEAYLYYKLTNEPKGSGELKSMAY